MPGDAIWGGDHGVQKRGPEEHKRKVGIDAPVVQQARCHAVKHRRYHRAQPEPRAAHHDQRKQQDGFTGAEGGGIQQAKACRQNPAAQARQQTGQTESPRFVKRDIDA